MSAAAADRVRAFRRRQREARLLLPRIDDELVDCGLLAEDSTEDAQAVRTHWPVLPFRQPIMYPNA